MPVLPADTLRTFVTDLFAAQGMEGEVAAAVADHLVSSNLKGHDSHGVIRVAQYVQAMQSGLMDPAGRPEVVSEAASLLIVDGHYGPGAYVGRAATRLAMEKAKATGLCVLSLRHAGHLGRIGEYAEIAAEAGLVSLFFSNGQGAGVLTAPYGGYQRRLSANPVAAGAPLPDGRMMIMDMACSIVAEGKLRVARSKGEPIAPGLIVNSRGEPSTDPEEFYADPPGALLPFGGHKGYALGMFVEVFAGALTGGGCSKAQARPGANTLFGLLVDPAALCGDEFFARELADLVEWVKSCPIQQGHSEILLPGEPERRTEAQRLREGITVDDATWSQLLHIAEQAGVPVPI